MVKRVLGAFAIFSLSVWSAPPPVSVDHVQYPTILATPAEQIRILERIHEEINSIQSVWNRADLRGHVLYHNELVLQVLKRVQFTSMSAESAISSSASRKQTYNSFLKLFITTCMPRAPAIPGQEPTRHVDILQLLRECRQNTGVNIRVEDDALVFASGLHWPLIKFIEALNAFSLDPRHTTLRAFSLPSMFSEEEMKKDLVLEEPHLYQMFKQTYPYPKKAAATYALVRRYLRVTKADPRDLILLHRRQLQAASTRAHNMLTNENSDLTAAQRKEYFDLSEVASALDSYLDLSMHGWWRPYSQWLHSEVFEDDSVALFNWRHFNDRLENESTMSLIFDYDDVEDRLLLEIVKSTQGPNSGQYNPVYELDILKFKEHFAGIWLKDFFRKPILQELEADDICQSYLVQSPL
jgi:hypothetical protein